MHHTDTLRGRVPRAAFQVEVVIHQRAKPDQQERLNR